MLILLSPFHFGITVNFFIQNRRGGVSTPTHKKITVIAEIYYYF
jgi:hypothetical protein